MLVAPFITREVAERCRQLHLRSSTPPATLTSKDRASSSSRSRSEGLEARGYVRFQKLYETDLAQLNAYWGRRTRRGEITQYLKPAQFTIYARELIARLVAAARMHSDVNGKIELLDSFWHFEAEKDCPDVVPPILAYADLLATHDGRNAEAARMIYEQRIAPASRTAQ